MAKRQKGWWPAIDQKRQQQLSQAVKHRKEGTDRLTSCAGPEGGAFLRSTTADGIPSLADAHFSAATKYILGMATMPPHGMPAHLQPQPQEVQHEC